MSGGYFNYSDFALERIADDIQQVILDNQKTPKELSEREFEWDFSDETIKKFHKAILLLKLAKIYVHRIDYLLEGDDSEETFHERLEEDLGDLIDWLLKGDDSEMEKEVRDSMVSAARENRVKHGRMTELDFSACPEWLYGKLTSDNSDYAKCSKCGCQIEIPICEKCSFPTYENTAKKHFT